MEVMWENGRADGAVRGQMSYTFLSCGCSIPVLLRALQVAWVRGVCLPSRNEGQAGQG